MRLWMQTPVGPVELPDHMANMVEAMTDEQLQESRYARGFVDPVVIAETERRRRAKMMRDWHRESAECIARRLAWEDCK